MTRNILILALSAQTLAPAAHAGGIGAVYIDNATPSIVLEVENVSGSPDVADRDLQLTTPDPMVHVDGDFGCPYGSTAVSIELQFGPATIHAVSPAVLMNLFVWDYSNPIALNQGYGSFQIDHAIDLPTTWDSEAAITFGFNPVKVVESSLILAEKFNADLVDWMRSDQVFMEDFDMNAVVWCDDGNNLEPGLATRVVDVTIWYRGDSNITYQSIVTTPGDVSTGEDDPFGWDSSGTGTGDPTSDPSGTVTGGGPDGDPTADPTITTGDTTGDDPTATATGTETTGTDDATGTETTGTDTTGTTFLR